MNCPECNHPNKLGETSCKECGFSLKGSPTGSQSSKNVGSYGARLVLESTGTIFRIRENTIVGREDTTIDIDLDGYPLSKYVSHRHAQICLINDTYYIEDLGSSNHTWVNQIKLAQGQNEPLKDGDIIRLAKVELTFRT